MNDIPVLTYLLVFLSVLVPYLAVSLWMGTAGRVQDKINSANVPPFFQGIRGVVDVLSSGVGASIAAAWPGAAEKTRDEILKSGYHLTAEQVFAGQSVAAGVAGFTVSFLVFILSAKAGSALGFGLVALVVGWFYPSYLVQKRAQLRQEEIVKSLPFAIDLLASAMRAGLDFVAAVRYFVTIGGKGALVVEFGLLLRQMELGKSRMEALDEMAMHVQTQEFTAFVAAVAHGTEIGASIIDTLQIQGEDMRRARFNLAEQKAARAPSIMIFPIAFFILPSVFAIVVVPVILRFMSSKGGL